jgi:aubergine-like protein
LRNEEKNRAIVQKILLQMNCKLGGVLWGVKIPLKKAMICGIDTYHEAGHNGITVGGFVASLNASYTKWYSKPCFQSKREELISGLVIAMQSSLSSYLKNNEELPERIILYR